jgi:hypothetical protein
MVLRPFGLLAMDLAPSDRRTDLVLGLEVDALVLQRARIDTASMPSSASLGFACSAHASRQATSWSVAFQSRTLSPNPSGPAVHRWTGRAYLGCVGLGMIGGTIWRPRRHSALLSASGSQPFIELTWIIPAERQGPRRQGGAAAFGGKVEPPKAGRRSRLPQ